MRNGFLPRILAVGSWSLWIAQGPALSGDNNLHLIDADPQTGFAIYRASKPDADDMRRFCELGIREMMVLSGNARTHEREHRDACPTLSVVYDEKQDAQRPLDTGFLERFDAWVAQARSRGIKIAFRCNCGCHRTGRLAAYYQMKYQHLSFEEARAILLRHGRWMSWYPEIVSQTRALYDHIHDLPCSTEPRHCVVRTNGNPEGG